MMFIVKDQITWLAVPGVTMLIGILLGLILALIPRIYLLPVLIGGIISTIIGFFLSFICTFYIFMSIGGNFASWNNDFLALDSMFLIGCIPWVIGWSAHY
jgi:hypothetical protein